MNFATWSIRNPIPIILLFVVLSLAGLWAFQKLPIQNIPDIDPPTVNITLTQPGAAPAQLETEVARKAEDALAALSGLKHIRTSITDGQVTISVEFVLEKSLSDALIETKNAVDGVRSDLPADLLPPVVTAVTVGGEAVLVYAVGSDRMDENHLSWFVDHTVAKAVLAVGGVGRFERIGGVQREVRVEIDPVSLASLGITAPDVSRQLRLVEQQSSGGQEQLGSMRQAVRTIGTVRQASDLAAFPIAMADGRKIRLDQVATVHDTFAERSQAALLNGRPAVGFRIYRAKGYDETRIAQGVQQAVAKLQTDDKTLVFEQVSGSINNTLERYKGSMHMLYEGAILAVLVIWCFLRDWRATLVSALALPLSILPTFVAMSWFGFSLNVLTLLALAVVVGILVDDAIVEIENIERHGHMGKPMPLAASDAVTEIALAVTATTLALVVVFLPTTTMGGVPGLFFKEFGWTTVLAVLASLLVARLLTPMLAAYFLTPKPPKSGEDGRIMTLYLRFVRWCLGHRKITLCAALAFFIGSLLLVPLIPGGLIPASDSGFTAIDIELPPGSTIDDTLAVTESARKKIEGILGIANVFAIVGSEQNSGSDRAEAGEVRKATLVVTFDQRTNRPTQKNIEDAIRVQLRDVAGARFALGSGPGEKLALILASDNSSALKATAHAVERELREVGQLGNISSTASLERPEIVIRPDIQRAAEQGVTTSSIGDVARIATGGDFDQFVARLDLDNRQIYIRVRMSDAATRDLSTFANLRVSSRSGLVPISSVASISVESGPTQINRYDRQRYVTVSADLRGMPLGRALAAATALPSIRDMPSGVKLIQTGDAEIMAELATGFGVAMITAVLLVYCVLVLLFKDFLQPVTILSAIPLSLGGAFAALLLAHSELDVPSMIGLLMLLGIVSKNSILLVEYAIVGHRDRNLPLYAALVDACHKRARPIVMTSTAMIAGMMPLALGIGTDASFRQPMATAVIGGLLTSTMLSLVVVPVVFTYVDGFERLIRRVFGHAGGPVKMPVS
jgi:multidrug efflux pump subunit AcrB